MTILIDRIGEMYWPKTGAIHYHAQLGLPVKGRAIKEWVVCWVLFIPIPRVFGQKRRDFAPLSYPELDL